MKERKPIFYDAERVRWRHTRHALEVAGAILTLLLAYFFATIVVTMEMPGGLLPDKPTYRAIPVKSRPRSVPTNPRARGGARGGSVSKVPQTYDPVRAAFYVSWDANSLASLKNHAHQIDLLIPEQLHAVTPDGALTLVDYDRNKTYSAGPAEIVTNLQGDKLHRWLKSANIDMPMMGLVNNYDGTDWRVKEMAALLANPASRHRLVENLAEFAVQARQTGIAVDFEEVPEASQKHFRQFAAELSPALHAVGLKLWMALPARDSAYDYAFFGAQCDAIILMNYDQHWLTSPAGPIAAQDWFAENLRQIKEIVPPSKLVVAIGSYAYDWSQAPKERAESMSVQEALLHAYESEATVEFDAASLNPHYSYLDEHNHVHNVWMLDGVTAYNELRASERLGVLGTAVWRLGSADSSLWAIWDVTNANDVARAKLQDIPPGTDLILEGDGDIWRIADTPKQGRRSFSYDFANDLITSERYEAYPLSYDIDQRGAAKKKIALSFDDGPDPKWTPRILDILRDRHVPALFFAIGEEAGRYPALLQREYAEGHAIGNHTYLHLPFDEISHAQLRLELNLTQRLIASTLGVKSILFRPPYGIDHQPEYAEEVASLPLPQEMGYLLVGARIDPHDWSQVNGQQIPAAEIVDGVLQQAPKGNIVLLHDGGGDRAQTVAALPQIIDSLRAQGYEFVAVTDLLGKTRGDVMPHLDPREQIEARADSFIFAIYHWLRVGMASIFVVGILLVSGRALVIGLLALIEKVRADAPPMPELIPSVSVLIPAHNEESVIVQTVMSVLRSHVPSLRVIVVNDGSADRTGELLDQHFGRDPRVMIIHQVNRGKAAALNRALTEADTEIVVTIDADTEIEADALGKLLRHFAAPSIGAMAGNVKVGNRSRWLTRWQALEYITSQNMEKRAFDLLNCITVVPGALGAWRRTAIEAAGGITSDTVAEDADLTIAIRRLGWRIGYDEEAIAWTEAPETAAALVRQRFRWTFGTLQSFWKHRDTLFRTKQGTLGWIALPNIFVFQLLLPLISPVIDLMFLGTVLIWALAQSHILRLPQLWTSADVERSLVFFLGFLLIDLFTCVVAFALEKDEDWTLLVPVLLQRFYYRQMMYVVLFRSVREAVRGRQVGWRGVEPEVPTAVGQA